MARGQRTQNQAAAAITPPEEENSPAAIRAVNLREIMMEATGNKDTVTRHVFWMFAQVKINIFIDVDDTRGLLEPDLLNKDWVDWESNKLMSFLMKYFPVTCTDKDKSLESMSRSTQCI